MTKNSLLWVYRILKITIFQGTSTTHLAPLNVEIVILTKDSCVKKKCLFFKKCFYLLPIQLYQILGMAHSGFAWQLESASETSVLVGICGPMRFSGFLPLCQESKTLLNVGTLVPGVWGGS